MTRAECIEFHDPSTGENHNVLATANTIILAERQGFWPTTGAGRDRVDQVLHIHRGVA